MDANQPGSFTISVENNSIHDYTANGVQVNGACAACAQPPGITAEITGNTISGVGPAGGIFQFAVFILNGAVGHITNNVLTEGLCGSVAISDCINERSEGVTLRAVGDGTVVDGNVITNAQSGIFINGANRLRVTNNQIRNIDAMSGMDIQGTASGFFTNSVITGNSIFNVGPIDQNASNNGEGCGINEYSGTGSRAIQSRTPPSMMRSAVWPMSQRTMSKGRFHRDSTSTRSIPSSIAICIRVRIHRLSSLNSRYHDLGHGL